MTRSGALAAALAMLGCWPSIANAQGYPSTPYPAQQTPGTGNAPARPSRPLETGGLAPPTSTGAHPAEAQVASALDRAEREDSGRGLEFVWLQVGGGYELTALTALSDGGLLPEGMDGSASGPAVSAGLGVRLVFLTLGATGRLIRTDPWDLWSLGARVAVHLPMGTLEPSFGLELGYAALAGLDDGAAAGLDVGGLSSRIDASLAWYVNPLLSIGATLDGSLTILGSDGPGIDGRGIGLCAGTRLVVGLHF